MKHSNEMLHRKPAFFILISSFILLCCKKKVTFTVVMLTKCVVFTHTHTHSFACMGLQQCKCELVCTVEGQVASCEAHRLGRLRGMLFLCVVRPPALCSETWLRGVLLYPPTDNSAGFSSSNFIYMDYVNAK